MSTRWPTTTTALLFVTVLYTAKPSQGHAVDLRPQINPLAEQLLADQGAVGLVVGIHRDGEEQVFGYGETERGKGAAPQGNTIYEIGSASKVFTGVMLADLVLRGRVNLDDPMPTYLPQGAKAQLANLTHITYEQLATHTSGLPGLPDNFQPVDMLNPYADYTFKHVFAFLMEYNSPRAPGEYEYSNFGMGLLGILLASRERQSYEELLIRRIADPCGMDDTCITLTEQQRSRLATPYDAALQPAKNWDFPALAGAGAIRSTTNDMLKFIAANLAEDDKPLTQTLQLSHKKRHSIPGGQAIGLAWHLAADGITRWHNGMTGGYASWVAVVPEHNVGVVVLANTATMQITEIGQQITRIASGAKIESQRDSHTGQLVRQEAERAAKNGKVRVAKEVLQSYEGVYAITPQFALTVTLEGNKLMVQATGQQKFQVYPESEIKFYYKVVDAQLTFVAGKRGKAEMLILHQNGANQVATRRD